MRLVLAVPTGKRRIVGSLSGEQAVKRCRVSPDLDMIINMPWLGYKMAITDAERGAT
jgi:hypothetical protein